MLAELSTRRYPLVPEPVGRPLEVLVRSTSTSADSRWFVAATETARADLLAASLGELDLVTLLTDGLGIRAVISVCVERTMSPASRLAPISVTSHL